MGIVEIVSVTSTAQHEGFTHPHEDDVRGFDRDRAGLLTDLSRDLEGLRLREPHHTGGAERTLERIPPATNGTGQSLSFRIATVSMA
jgi:hypothetical protein